MRVRTNNKEATRQGWWVKDGERITIQFLGQLNYEHD